MSSRPQYLDLAHLVEALYLLLLLGMHLCGFSMAIGLCTISTQLPLYRLYPSRYPLEVSEEIVTSLLDDDSTLV